MYVLVLSKNEKNHIYMRTPDIHVQVMKHFETNFEIFLDQNQQSREDEYTFIISDVFWSWWEVW